MPIYKLFSTYHTVLKHYHRLFLPAFTVMHPQSDSFLFHEIYIILIETIYN